MGTFAIRVNGPDQKAGPSTGNSVLQKRIFVAGSAVLYSVVVTNLGAADRWLFILDSAEGPITDDLPDFPPMLIAPDQTVSFDIPAGAVMTKGISVGFSTDPNNYLEEPSPTGSFFATWRGR